MPVLYCVILFYAQLYSYIGFIIKMVSCLYCIFLKAVESDGSLHFLEISVFCIFVQVILSSFVLG